MQSSTVRRSSWTTKSLAFVMAASGLLSGCASTEPRTAERLTGTVIQFNPAHNLWVRSDWAKLFRSLRTLGMTQIVVQWTVAGKAAYYPSRQFRPGPMPPLGALLDLADESGMRVLIGLAHEPKYWAQIAEDPAQVERHLRDLRSRSMQAARELAPLVAHRKSFEGWYLSEEIDDLNWRDPARRAVLTTHLKALTSELRTVDPHARIAISGFANAGTDLAALEGLWANLLGNAPELGIVLFQDGVGVGKLSLDEVAPVLGAVKRSADGRARELRVVIEVFRQTAGAPIDQQHFAAEPAPISRIRRQMAIASAFSSSLLAFSVPDYMRADGPPPMTQLFEQYRRACIDADC
ncbi:MAG: DUF4434 domain-containing protein [Variovorax sp.]|nr:MAG: DUF4434 domain-containing protein [Variovorax sp.]